MTVKKKARRAIAATLAAAVAFSMSLIGAAPAQADPGVWITGNTWVGETITPNLWNNEGWTATSYAWHWVDPTNDLSRSYINHRGHVTNLTLTEMEVGKRVTVRITYTKPGSAPFEAWSLPSSIVTATKPVPPTPVLSVVIRGNAKVGQSIEAFPSATEGYVASEYRWYSVDATGKQAFINHYGNAKILKPGKLEVGKKVKVNVIFRKAGSPNLSAWSGLSATVLAADLPKGSVRMVGTTKVGKKITAQPKAPKGYTVASYQWYRVALKGKAKGKAKAIAKYGKKKVLKVGKKEVGTKVKVRVIFKKSGEPNVTAWSSLSAKVKKK